MTEIIVLTILAACVFMWYRETRPGRVADQSRQLLESYQAELRGAQLELREATSLIGLLKAELASSRGDIKQSQEAIRILRAASGIHPGYDEQRELLRRAYHAIRILHEYRFCKLIGCEYCALGKEIVTTVGTQKLMQETTIRKLAKDRSEQGAGIAGYLAHIKDRVI